MSKSILRSKESSLLKLLSFSYIDDILIFEKFMIPVLKTLANAGR